MQKSSEYETAVVVCMCSLIFLLVFAIAGGWYFAVQRSLCKEFGLKIAPIYQYDYEDVVCTVNGEGKSVASSGCGTTCLAMVIGYLQKTDAPSPEKLFEQAYDNGDYYGYGLSHDALSRLAEMYGVDCIWIEGQDEEEKLLKALRNGYPVIAHMGPGTFTDEGHYILLRSLTDDGRVVVNDPNSAVNTWKTHTLKEIVIQGKGNTPFMVCQKAR